MSLIRLQKIIFGIAGITVLTIGSPILVAPQSFYSGYGIALGQEPSLLSELRAPGAALATLGAIMLAGLIRAGLETGAVVAALIVYLAFPVRRIVSLVVDGTPLGGIFGALAIEVVIAGLCLAAFDGLPLNVANRKPLADVPG